jgi:hypothetical protein
MPAPSATTAQNINTEIGYSSTASVNLNETRVRNLAAKSSGAISYGDCRWGINFPAVGHVNNVGSETFISDYANTSTLSVLHTDVASGSSTATVSLELLSGGTFRTVAGSFTRDSTWLTSGAAGDYTARLDLDSGSNTPTGSATGTDLALSSNRTWSFTVSTGPGTSIASATGNLIIKDGGGTLITRPFSLYAEANAF